MKRTALTYKLTRVLLTVMFANPSLRGDRILPELPLDNPRFRNLLTATGVPYAPTVENLPDIKDFVIAEWLRPAHGASAEQLRPCETVVAYNELRQAGLIDAITPPPQRQDYVLLDGGTKPVIDYRLAFLGPYLGTDITKDVTLYGGQRLRLPNDDRNGSLESIAIDLLPSVDSWARKWIQKELDKPQDSAVGWHRSFATEQESAILALLCRYGKRLEHIQTHPRPPYTPVHPSIPAATTLSEEFRLENITVRVINSPAIIRMFAGQALPADEARPSALSSFGEWLVHVQPHENANVLLIAHNPNIYRSWLDLVLGRVAVGREDLQLSAAGPAIEGNRSYGYVLQALGRILLCYYNHLYRNSQAGT